MVSLTQRISKGKQPRGRYVSPKVMTVIEIQDNATLNDKENIHAILVGLAVDYLTRFLNGADKEDVFNVSLAGASIIKRESLARDLLKNISGIDDKSIMNIADN